MKKVNHRAIGFILFYFVSWPIHLTIHHRIVIKMCVCVCMCIIVGILFVMKRGGNNFTEIESLSSKKRKVC